MQYQALVAGGGNNTLVPAQQNKVIEVLAIFFQCPALSTVQLKSGTSALTGAMSFSTGGGLNLPPQSGNEALFRTNEGEALVLTVSGLGAGAGGGMIMQYSDP